jgi:corrinoid protein of di/trimethylamine methyltransferase
VKEMSKEELIGKLSTAVKEGSIEECGPLAETGVEAGYDPLEVIEGVSGALKEVGDRFGRGEMFLTELMFCAEAAKAAMAILMEEIKRQNKDVRYLGRVLIGSVAGDIHDIGKSLAAALLTAEGFEVIDIGVDVPDETFIEKVEELKPDILGMSALTNITMFKFGDVIKALEEAGMRDKVKVIVGGAFVDQDWADQSGADAYGADAVDGVAKVKALLKIK